MGWNDIQDPKDGRRIGLCGTIKNIYWIELLGETEIGFEFYFDGQDNLESLDFGEFNYFL
jgi:hypothetical protein